jgi:hypothetical protein
MYTDVGASVRAVDENAARGPSRNRMRLRWGVHLARCDTARLRGPWALLVKWKDM